MFLKIILCYLLILTGYIAYILHSSTPDHLHAGSLLIAAFANLILAVITLGKADLGSLSGTEEINLDE